MTCPRDVVLTFIDVICVKYFCTKRVTPQRDVVLTFFDVICVLYFRTKRVIVLLSFIIQVSYIYGPNKQLIYKLCFPTTIEVVLNTRHLL